jgi:CheY-like chemotaxis protein
VDIRITLLEEPLDRVGFVIEVQDTGIGMRAEEQTRIFNPFAQARDSISREFGGTGLGLAISRGFVDMMGGSLTVASEAGKGSSFTLRLSLPGGTEQEAQSLAAPAGLLDGARILVVDDNAINLRVAVAILTGLGAVPTTVTGGSEALAIMRDAFFDLVLMDVHMPGMGGVETLNRIRAGQAGDRNVPVVACTADAMTSEVSRYLDLGFDAVQCKPIVPAQLASTLARVLSQKRSTSPDQVKAVLGEKTV